MNNRLQSSAPYVGIVLFFIGVAAVVGAVSLTSTGSSTVANTAQPQTVGQGTPTSPR